jgi:hypothetical protein
MEPELTVAPFTGPGELNGWPAFTVTETGEQIPRAYIDQMTDDELLGRARALDQHPSRRGKDRPNIYFLIAADRAASELLVHGTDR